MFIPDSAAIPSLLSARLPPSCFVTVLTVLRASAARVSVAERVLTVPPRVGRSAVDPRYYCTGLRCAVLFATTLGISLAR